MKKKQTKTIIDTPNARITKNADGTMRLIIKGLR